MSRLRKCASVNSPTASAKARASKLLDRSMFLAKSLREIAPPTYEWIWDGYLARGQTTLLVSQWKAGKTTLLSVLLKKLADGGELAGRRVRPARPLVVSEEDATLWNERITALDIGNHAAFMCQPDLPDLAEQAWPDLIEAATEAVKERGIKLVVIDPLSSFLAPNTESNPQAMHEALRRLKPLKQAGAAILILHHPAKGRPEPGQAARGTGLLSAVVDITIELNLYARGVAGDRRRKLNGWSRHSATPTESVIQWTENGLDYIHLGDFDNEVLLGEWQSLKDVFDTAESKLTVKMLLKRWPLELGVEPGLRTVYRRLESAVAAGLLTKTGAGTKPNPYRYCLTTQTQKPDEDPLDPDSFADTF